MRSGRGAHDEPAGDEAEELFVDPVPTRRPSRAADRRRERGQAPPDDGVKDTRTSLPQREDNEASASQQSRFESGSLTRGTLLCVQGPEEGLSLKLIEGSYTVGRARDNNFVLKDIAASRHHLRIDIDKRGARAVDLGSGNGTRVNGRKFVEHALTDGDRIEIGSSVFVFEGASSRRTGGEEAAPNEARARVIEAAAALAAELSEKAKAGEAAEDDLLKTRGPPANRKAGARDPGQPRVARREPDSNKQSSRNPRTNGTDGAQVPRAEKLWKETFTNLPLDEIMPANEPLRGRRPPDSAVPTASPPVKSRAPRSESRVALPRAAPLPVPPPRDLETSGALARAGASFLVPLVATALGVIVLGGGAYWIYTRVQAPPQEPPVVATSDAEQDYARAMASAQAAFAAGDWVRCLEYSTAALQLRPADPVATTYQRDARARLETVAPPPAVPALPATPASSAAAVAAVAAVASAPSAQPASADVASAAQVAVAAPPVAAPASPPPRPAVPPPVVGEKEPARTPPSPPVRRAERVAPKAPKPAPAPAPPPRRAAKVMSEEAAADKHAEAVAAFKSKDETAACALLEEIMAKAAPDGDAHDRADSLYRRKCR